MLPTLRGNRVFPSNREAAERIFDYRLRRIAAWCVTVRVSSGSHLQAELKKQCQNALGFDLPGRWRFRDGGSRRFDVCLVKNRKRVDPATNHRALFAPAPQLPPACLHFPRISAQRFPSPPRHRKAGRRYRPRPRYAMRPWCCGASASSSLARGSMLVAGASDVDAAMATTASHPPRSRCKAA